MEERKGKKLLRSCMNQLSKITKTDNGSNEALYPVVIIFLGHKTVSHFSAVREILDTNWRNGEYLKYIQITKNGDGFQCLDLITGIYENNLSVFIEQSLVEMLKTDEYIFQNKLQVRLKYILAGEEEAADEYFDLMLDMNLGKKYNLLQTIFIMMDESTAEKRRRISEFLHFIGEKRKNTEDKLGAVYLLSNYLKDGNVLLDYRLGLNYRLVADLILLGGNRGTGSHGNAEAVIEGYNTIKTAAYALVEKPVRSIAIFSLLKIMECLMKENLRSYQDWSKDVMQLSEDLQEKLGIRRGKIQCLEDIFQDHVIKIFPSPSELSYLAYIDENEFKEIHKEKKISFTRLNQATGGNWSLFFEEHYKKELDKLLSDQNFIAKCLTKIEKNWRLVLTYEDALYGLTEDRVLEALEEFSVSESDLTGNTIEESVHSHAVAKMRTSFYSDMIRKLLKLLTTFHYEAEHFLQTYQALEDEIRKEVIDEEDRNIRNYYEHLAEHFLRQEEAEISKRIFRIENDGNGLCRELEQIFGELIASDPIFSMSFEQEMQARLDTMSDEARVMMVKRVLEEKIENKIRLRGSAASYENNLRGIFYLMNKDAKYAREVKHSNHTFTLFHLKRTDCIEKIAIYDLDPLGSNEYCNLTEMAGESP